MSTPAARRAKPKIKPPRKHGNDISIDQTWAELARNIREIQNNNASNLSFEHNYRFAYNMVLLRHGEKLYNGVKQLVAENLETLAKERIIPVFPTGMVKDGPQLSQESEILLKALKSVWDDHTSNMTRLGQILQYMDRVHTKSANVPPTWDVGLDLFLRHILRSPIKDHLVSAVLNEIQYEREGYMINRSTVKGCVDVFLGLIADADTQETVYKRDLEPPFLKESEAFYRAEGERLAETCDSPEYLRRAEAHFLAEEDRIHHYLHHQTEPALRSILQDHLLSRHLTHILSAPTGLDSMLDMDKYDDLDRLFRLFSMVPAGIPSLKRALRESISRRGKEINQLSLGGSAEPKAEPEKGKGKGKARATAQSDALSSALRWVQDVLNLKDKFDTAWEKSFQSNRDVESTLNEAFGTFINMNEKSPEFISLFIDDHLKRGLKGKSDDEVEQVLDKTITVFRYITEKDVFERYYKAHLSKRLLNARSVSDDAERGMLAKLKVECGFQFTQKLEGMFHDMKISAEHMDKFRAHLLRGTSLQPPAEVSVIVMTSTFWPVSMVPVPCAMPGVLLKSCQAYERFYMSQHSGRRLTWQPSLGHADVRVRFNARTHDLNVSTMALVVLLLFEDVEDDQFLTYGEIKEATGIADAELQRHLQSLACAKFKILKKHPHSRDVDPSDSFSFNADFSAPMQKIKISTVSSRPESNDERKETRDHIDEERRHQTDACIVRIMKDRKRCGHNDLINEVTRQLSSRFHPNPLDIKKRIENLIEREYLERCDDRKSYNYLALSNGTSSMKAKVVI
ncbi:Cullin [Schizophyllum commune]